MDICAGSTVRIKTVEELCELYGKDRVYLFHSTNDHVGFVAPMQNLCDTEQTVDGENYAYSGCPRFHLECGFWWPARALELVNDGDDGPEISVDEWRAIALTIK